MRAEPHLPSTVASSRRLTALAAAVGGSRSSLTASRAGGSAAKPSPDPEIEVDVDYYQQHGAVLIKNLLTPPQLQRLREGIDENLAQPGPFGANASAPDDPGRFFEDFCNWDRIPAYQDVIFGSSIPRVAAKLMGSDTVRLYHDHL